MVIANDANAPTLGEAPVSAAQPTQPRVFIVSDVRLLSDGLILSLARQSSVSVVGAAEVAASPTYVATLRPHVVLLDVGTPGGLGLSATFRQAQPDIKVIAIAIADVEQEVFDCAEAGVSGFLSRNASIQDVLTAIHCAVRNELVCSPRIAALLFSRLATKASKRSDERDNESLTRREHEIASLITRGLSNKEIARELRIQNATVKNHIHSILGKLRVRRRGQVAARMHATLLRREVQSVADHHMPGTGHGAVAQLD